jgi:hypothetical protein
MAAKDAICKKGPQKKNLVVAVGWQGLVSKRVHQETRAAFADYVTQLSGDTNELKKLLGLANKRSRKQHIQKSLLKLLQTCAYAPAVVRAPLVLALLLWCWPCLKS